MKLFLRVAVILLANFVLISEVSAQTKTTQKFQYLEFEGINGRIIISPEAQELAKKFGFKLIMNVESEQTRWRPEISQAVISLVEIKSNHKHLLVLKKYFDAKRKFMEIGHLIVMKDLDNENQLYIKSVNFRDKPDISKFDFKVMKFITQ